MTHMGYLLVALLSSVMIAFTSAKPNLPSSLVLDSQEFVDYINSAQSSWVAKYMDPNSIEQLKSILCVKNMTDEIIQYRKQIRPADDDDNITLPKNFDARSKWPNCPTISEIRDQGGCGSCWAFGAVEAMSDRICIASKGEKKVHLSAQDLTSCDERASGCGGGSLITGFVYWKTHGIVTGGQYGSGKGCRPYEIAPCDHAHKGKLPPCTKHVTPECVRECPNTEYNVEYSKDLYFGQEPYEFRNEIDAVMKEIYKNGPVEAGFTVYIDFYLYTSGVYKHVSGKKDGEHAIRILGWGVDDQTNEEYWLCANSWNPHWGDKGFFKILKGKNECGIENSMVAAMPKLE